MNREKLANNVSNVFNPLYASAVFFLIVDLSVAKNIADFVRYWMATGLFFSLLPLLDVHRRLKKGLIGDAHISNREDRIGPFLVSLLCAVAGLIAVYLVDAPNVIKAVSWAGVITGALITAITSAWKVSLHAAGITSISVVLVLLYGLPALPLFLLVPLVFWARLTLKKHTIAQLLVGALLAASITLGLFRLFGLA